MKIINLDKELKILKRRITREIAARKASEAILENKSLELYEVNQKLKTLNEDLERQINVRTEALRKSELRYRQVVESAQDIIYRTDMNGKVTYVNPIGVKYAGIPQQDILGRHYSEFLHENDKPDIISFYSQEKGRYENTYRELPLIKPDGNIMWVGQQVQPILENDILTGFIAVARDITARVTAQNELEKIQDSLKRSEEKYRGIIENLELGLLEVDQEGKVIKAYDRFCKMIGYSEDELLGEDPNYLIVPLEYRSLISEQNKNRKYGDTGVYEIQLIKKNGERIWVIISGAPFYDLNGNVIGSIGIHLDITNRKQLEENLAQAKQIAEHAQKAEKMFLAKMSHEIRTPLNAIIGMSHLIQQAESPTEKNEYLNTLQSSASLLQVLLNDILDYSKIESNNMEVLDSNFNLGDVIQKIVDALKSKADKKELQFFVEFDPSLKLNRRGDVKLVNQVLVNLISNAIKFTHKGHVKVEVRYPNTHDDRNYVEFVISDTGIGIPIDKFETIFMQFKQADNSISNSYGGSGLGLYITKSIVELLRGSIQVDSIENEGSTFIVVLPLSIAEKLMVSENIKKNQNTFRIPEANVLLVEDNKFNIEYLQALLNNWGAKIDVAYNGREAVNKTLNKKYDIILMDLFMPEMNGIEATEIIRNSDNNPNRNIPIIGLSASAFKEDYEHAINHGMNEFLTKPVLPNQLSDKMNLYLHSPIQIANNLSKANEINHDKIMEIYQNDIALANEIFGIYLNTIDNELFLLKKYAEGDDLDRLSKQLHKMKPTFGMIGLEFLQEECYNLKNQIKSGESISTLQSEIIDLINKIKSSIPVVEDARDRLNLLMNDEY